MNGSTVIISPPDGDMAQYLESLDRLRPLGLAAIAPGHGDLITDPIGKIDEYVSHRLAREAAVAEALAAAAGPVTVEQLVPTVYADVDESRFLLAQRSLWAHLRKLVADGRATAGDPDDIQTTWRAVAG
jgi:glyoxylase-like metal-dependent hydrolase (beta-lactamase superfamily II)